MPSGSHVSLLLWCSSSYCNRRRCCCCPLSCTFVLRRSFGLDLHIARTLVSAPSSVPSASSVSSVPSVHALAQSSGILDPHDNGSIYYIHINCCCFHDCSIVLLFVPGLVAFHTIRLKPHTSHNRLSNILGNFASSAAGPPVPSSSRRPGEVLRIHYFKVEPLLRLQHPFLILNLTMFHKQLAEHVLKLKQLVLQHRLLVKLHL